MFADAYEMVKGFTFPVVISTRTWDGGVSSGLAAFVVLNDQGWFATSAHVIDPWLVWRRHRGEIARYREAAARLEAAQGRSPAVLPKPDPNWILNQSFWWGWNGPQLVEVHVRRESDLAVGRLDPFRPEAVSHYPVLKDPEQLRPGTSLCRVGFPFHELQTAWEEETGRFLLPDQALPVPLFPLEGIFTRQVNTAKGGPPRFIETSSPGLQGQSGGPLCDTAGRVWGIQSRTRHLDLGFAPEVGTRAPGVREHQFLNVGMAAHPAELRGLLDEKGISYRAE